MTFTFKRSKCYQTTLFTPKWFDERPCHFYRFFASINFRGFRDVEKKSENKASRIRVSQFHEVSTREN